MFNSKFSCAHLKSEVVALHVLALLAENSENSFRMPVLNQYYQMLQVENQVNSFLKKELKKKILFFFLNPVYKIKAKLPEDEISDSMVCATLNSV